MHTTSGCQEGSREATWSVLRYITKLARAIVWNEDKQFYFIAAIFDDLFAITPAGENCLMPARTQTHQQIPAKSVGGLGGITAHVLI